MSKLKGAKGFMKATLIIKASENRAKEDLVKSNLYLGKLKNEELEYLAHDPMKTNALMQIAQSLGFLLKLNYKSNKKRDNFFKSFIQLFSGDVTDKSAFEAMGVTKDTQTLSKHIETILRNGGSEFLNKLLSGGFTKDDESLIKLYAPNVSINQLNQFSKAFVIKDSRGEDWGLAELLASFVNSFSNLQKPKGAM